MRYGVVATRLIERLTLALGKVPLPVVDVVFGPLCARSLMAAAEVGIFSALADGPRRAGQLAEALDLDAEVLESLLRTLSFAGYLRLRGGRFALTRLARRQLVPGGAEDLTAYLAWSRTQWRLLDGLEPALRREGGGDFHRTLREPAAWRDYQRAMLDLARRDAPWVAARVPVAEGARRLLDVGGGHGLYGALVCRRHPPLRATVLELPAAIVAARELARELAVDDVVEHRAADLCEDDWGDGWDVLILSNLLHHLTPAAVNDVLRRARRALVPGGTVAVWEIERPRRGTRVAAGDVTSLLFQSTSAAATYHGSDLRDRLDEAGFSRLRAMRPRLSPGGVLVVGATR